MTCQIADRFAKFSNSLAKSAKKYKQQAQIGHTRLIGKKHDAGIWHFAFAVSNIILFVHAQFVACQET